MAKVQGEETTLASETMATMRRRAVKEARKAEQAGPASGIQGCAYRVQAAQQIFLSGWLPESLIMELPNPVTSPLQNRDLYSIYI